MRTDDVLEVMHELVAFVRVAEAGSFSAAARQHGQTPSAVSRQVARLEKVMGVALLQRSTRQLRLTEAGLEVLERGREMVAAAQATVRVAEGHVGEPRGRVRISAPKAVARQLLHQPLLDFLQRYPAVDLHLMVDQDAKFSVVLDPTTGDAASRACGELPSIEAVHAVAGEAPSATWPIALDASPPGCDQLSLA